MFSITKGMVTAAALAAMSGALTAQTKPDYVRSVCVKVRDGKQQAYAESLRDVVTKTAQARVDAGIYSAFLIMKSVEPIGQSARCDYRLVSVSPGFPEEPLTRQQVSADLTKSGVVMSYDQMVATRNELSYLVGMEIWRRREIVGQSVVGGYARLNYYKVKAGHTPAEWLELEGAGWKPLAESQAKDTKGSAWSASSLVAPNGTSYPYNGITVDSYPSWAALANAGSPRAAWDQIHPNQEFTAYMDRVNSAVDRVSMELVNYVEILRGKSPSASTNQ